MLYALGLKRQTTRPNTRVGLRLVRKLWARNMNIFSNSQLVVNQVNDIYLVKGEKMATYLKKANEQLSSFFIASFEVILWSENWNANALAKLALTRDADLLDAVSVEYPTEPIIHS